MPYKVFVAGEEALAADANAYLMSQTVPRFTNAAQRTAQLTAPVLNQLSILDSRPGITDYWNGSAWVAVGGAREVFFAATPNALAPLGGTGTSFPFSVTLPIAGTLIVQGQAAVYRNVPGTANSSAYLRMASGSGAPAITASVDSNFQVAPDLGWSTVPFSAAFAAAAAGVCNFILVFNITSVDMKLFNYQGSVRIQPT